LGSKKLGFGFKMTSDRAPLLSILVENLTQISKNQLMLFLQTGTGFYKKV
jgi:hypothetical protein